MPRWAIKYWRSVRADLDDFVLIAGPNHGTTAAGTPNPVTGAIGGMPPAFYQFSPSSNFVHHVNFGDETPGNIDYTTLLAGETSELNAKIPQAVNLNSWPTSFFLGRDGRVRSVHAGFAGKAAGEFHIRLKAEVTSLVEKLLNEK